MLGPTKISYFVTDRKPNPFRVLQIIRESPIFFPQCKFPFFFFLTFFLENMGLFLSFYAYCFYKSIILLVNNSGCNFCCFDDGVEVVDFFDRDFWPRAAFLPAVLECLITQVMWLRTLKSEQVASEQCRKQWWFF